MDEFDFEEIMRQQRLTLRSVAQESETDGKIKLISVINSMTTSKTKRLHREAVVIEAQLEGMSESEVERTLELLKQDHIIDEPEEGFIRKI